MKCTDNFLAWIAESFKEKLSDLVFVAPPAIEVGSVVVTKTITQFHRDGDNNPVDVHGWTSRINLTFYGEGAMFLVLKTDLERLDVMNLESAATGWIRADDVKLYK